MLAFDQLSSERFRKLLRKKYEHLVEAGFFRDEPIERYTNIVHGDYSSVTKHGRDDSLVLPSFSDVSIAVREILLP